MLSHKVSTNICIITHKHEQSPRQVTYKLLPLGRFDQNPYFRCDLYGKIGTCTFFFISSCRKYSFWVSLMGRLMNTHAL